MPLAISRLLRSNRVGPTFLVVLNRLKSPIVTGLWLDWPYHYGKPACHVLRSGLLTRAVVWCIEF